MKKALKTVALVMIAAVILSAFAGCAGLDKKIVGKWEDTSKGAAVEFREDGTVTFDSGSSITVAGIPISGSVDGKYTLDAESDPAKVTVTLNTPSILGLSLNADLVFNVTLEKDTLTLTNSDLNLTYTMTKAGDSK